VEVKPPPEIIVNDTPAPPEFEVIAPEQPVFEQVEPDFQTPTQPTFETPPEPEVSFPTPNAPVFNNQAPVRPDFDPVEIDIDNISPGQPEFEEIPYQGPGQVIEPSRQVDRPDIFAADAPVDMPSMPQIVFEQEPTPRDQPRDRPQDEGPVATNAPSVLASDERAETIEEINRAVPEEQSDQMFDPITGRRDPTLGGPLIGGGATPPSGGTSLPPSGPRRNGDWTYTAAPEGLPGGQGLNLDMRCREAGRTHEECPEYLRQFQGRGTDGFERFGAHSTAGIPARDGSRTAGGGGNDPYAIGGGSDIYGVRPHTRPVGIGDNSVNAGGPSTTILDDGPEVNLHRDYGRLPPEGDPNRVRDIFGEEAPPDYDVNDIIILPEED